jgi:hypothetical protein
MAFVDNQQKSRRSRSQADLGIMMQEMRYKLRINWPQENLHR